MSNTFTVSLNGSPQLVTGPHDVPVVILKLGDAVQAYLNNCPDEHLPLETDDALPAVNSRGEIFCGHHQASFDGCSGCFLRPGTARHIDRLREGLISIPVVEFNGQDVTLQITPDVVSAWDRIRRIRFRKSFGRGVRGAVRHQLARLAGKGPAHILNR